MLSRRIIPCLDVRGGRVVKGVRFRDHVDMGDIVDLALIPAEVAEQAEGGDAQADGHPDDAAAQVPAARGQLAGHLAGHGLDQFGRQVLALVDGVADRRLHFAFFTGFQIAGAEDDGGDRAEDDGDDQNGRHVHWVSPLCRNRSVMLRPSDDKRRRTRRTDAAGQVKLS